MKEQPFAKLEELSRGGLSGSEKEKEEYACGFLPSFDTEALRLWVRHTSCTVVSTCSFGGMEIPLKLKRDFEQKLWFLS